MAWPIMCLNIFLVIIDSYRLYGLALSRASVGGSVARANDAKESIIKLTHSIWIGVSISCSITAAVINVKTTATTLTVN